MPKAAAAQQMTVKDMDELDGRILDQLQNAFPLSARPFAEIAAKAGTTEAEVLARTRAYKERQVIRQLSAIFDTKSLGYKSSLIAARYPDARLDAAAETINGHPGVSHNYARNHSFNLWFTLAVPPDSKLGLEKTMQLMEKETQAEAMRLLPTLRLFKIGVDLDVTGERPADARADAPYTEDQRAKVFTVSPEEKTVIREAQRDLPIVSEPWVEAAADAGVTVPRLLEVLATLKERGQMRRVAAVLYHRKMGFRANGMGVWKVPADRVDAVGPAMGSFRSVSHCYLRPTYPDWPYNIFTMVHATTKAECEEVFDAISKATEVPERISLYSTKEYKKTRVPYFTKDMDAWEASRV